MPVRSSKWMRRRSQGAELDEIERVYRHRLAELRRVATAITGNRDVALDAVQDAFARAIRLRASFDGRGTLDGWLWRIVVNTAGDAARATRPHAALEDIEVAGPQVGDLHALVAQLPERQRLTLFLRYYADLDYATIAAALDVAPGTVGATLAQARDSLRDLLSEVRT